jgi:tRNA (guanine37-N1)-methyltransferase
VRLVPGVLGDPRSPVEESFAEPSGTDAAAGGLEHPHYTRPRVYRGRAVPDVLLHGDHARIAAWRAQAARARTARVRPDLHSPDDSRDEHPS